MPLGPLVYGIAGGIMVHVGLLHLRVGLGRRPRDAVHLSFSAVALSSAAAAISTWAAQSATTASEYVAILRGPWFVSASLSVAAYAWFLRYWTGFRPRALLLGLTAVAAALVVVGLAPPQRGLLTLIDVGLLGWLVVVVVTSWQLLCTVLGERSRALLEADADLTSRAGELDLLHEIARITTAVKELEPALAEVLATTGTLLHAQAGMLRLHPTGGDPAVTVPWFGGEPDDELPEQIDSLARIAAGDGSGGERAALIVTPLLHGDERAGVLVLAREEQAPFSEREHRLAESVAADVTELVVRHRLLAALRSSATAEERQRIARELHDSVTQTLYSVSMIAEALPQTYERDPGAGRQATGQLRELMLTALAELRALLLELRPASIEKAGLGRLVHEQADTFTAMYRVPTDVVVLSEPAVGMDEKLAVYWAVRELLANVGRHADATRVALHLRTLPGGGGRLDVVDDGRGFRPSGIDGDHHGLAIVRERFAAMGGTLAVTSAPGEGTHVVLEWHGG